MSDQWKCNVGWGREWQVRLLRWTGRKAMSRETKGVGVRDNETCIPTGQLQDCHEWPGHAQCYCWPAATATATATATAVTFANVEVEGH